jgi:hypothetical protein
VIVLPDAVTVTGRVVVNGKPATNAGVVVTDARRRPLDADHGRPEKGGSSSTISQGRWGMIVAAPDSP